MHKQRGFTLLELIITIAIAGILLTIAAPSFQQMILNNRLTTQANDLVSAITLTRSEAVRRGSRVTICPSTTGTACTAGDWNVGWIVFADPDNDLSTIAADEILRVHEPLEGDITLSWSNANNYVSYVSTGFTDLYPGDAGVTNGGFDLTHSSGKIKEININRIGRINAPTN